MRGSMNRTSRCAYCGAAAAKRDLEREHVFPRCCYPASRGSSKVQRLTVPACRACNGSWSDDEAHFRSIMVIAPRCPARGLGTRTWSHRRRLLPWRSPTGSRCSCNRQPQERTRRSRQPVSSRSCSTSVQDEPGPTGRLAEVCLIARATRGGSNGHAFRGVRQIGAPRGGAFHPPRGDGVPLGRRARRQQAEGDTFLGKERDVPGGPGRIRNDRARTTY